MSQINTRTILILTANPVGTTQIRLAQEVRDICEGLKRSQCRDTFKLEQRWAVRPRDIQRAMLEVNPQIVHFSGHGAGDEGLAFENNVGKVMLIDGVAIAKLFELFADQIECVVLNACYSEIQAHAISQHIAYVIGMNKAISDSAAIEFSVGFYDALGAGKPVDFAYRLGCSAIRLAGCSENMIPILKKKGDDSKSLEQTVTYQFVLTGSVEECDEQKVRAILTHLQKLTGDASLTFLKIERGSIKLTFEGSSEGFRRLQELRDTGQLSKILDHRVQNLIALNPETHEELNVNDFKISSEPADNFSGEQENSLISTTRDYSIHIAELDRVVTEVLLNEAEDDIHKILPFIQWRLEQFGLENFCKPRDIFIHAYLIAIRSILGGTLIKNIPTWFKSYSFSIIHEFSRMKAKDTGGASYVRLEPLDSTSAEQLEIQLTWLIQVLEQLPSQEQLILRLRMKGQTYKQIADQCGGTEEQLRQKVHHILKKPEEPDQFSYRASESSFELHQFFSEYAKSTSQPCSEMIIDEIFRFLEVAMVDEQLSLIMNEIDVWAMNRTLKQPTDTEDWVKMQNELIQLIKFVKTSLT